MVDLSILNNLIDAEDTRKLTPQQEAFCDAFTKTSSSIILIAVAGSGKTTTLVEGAKRHSKPQDIRAVAFNVKIKVDFARKFPQGVECLTLNGLGHRAWANAMGRNLTLDPKKVGKCTTAAIRGASSDLWFPVKDLVQKMKVEGVIPPGVHGRGLLPWSQDTMDYLADRYDLEIDTEIMDCAAVALKQSIREAYSGTIDFDDQLYMTTCFSAPVPKSPVLLIDEAQDLSQIQHSLVERAGERLIAVGDPRQSIYGFRGAATDSLNQFKERFNAMELPLSVSFRCARSIVNEALPYCPQIRPADNAIDGVVKRLESWGPTTIHEGDAILCRNVAPIVTLAYRLLRGGRRVHVVGRDIGAGLKNLIKKLGLGLPMDQFQGRVADWRDREIANAKAKEDDRKIEAAHDKVESILSIISSAEPRDSNDLLKVIEKIFSDENAPITLSTIHKAKGMEWKRVFFLDSFLCPSHYAEKAIAEGKPSGSEMMQQERNLYYVAVTRAMEELYYVESDLYKRDDA